ncbi:MAG: hypothetical protein IJN86_05175 [Clostridia bacterium]|nr:hypothetical protein [Clostridia bacterium]
MAIWQVPFLLVKKEQGYAIDSFLASLQTLSMHFPENPSWSNCLKQFGDIESTCLEISFEDTDVIGEIELRVDIRSITLPQLCAICEFARANDLVLNYEGEVCEATTDKFLTILRSSNAYKFVKDPIRFIEQIEHK